MDESILVPLGFFGAIFGSIWLIAHFSFKKNALVHETIRQSLEHGRDLNEETVKKLSGLLDPRTTDLRRGVLLVTLSLAIMILGVIAGQDDGDAFKALLAISIFPLLLGVAYLGLWRFAKKNSSL
jgi:hypothetical protein